MEASALTGSVGRIEAENVALFREHSIHVFEPSIASKAPTGWYPDALIPIAGGDAEARAAAKYPALPVRVEPGTNQGVWVDVYIPRNTSPGEYSGTISVTADGAQLNSVPVKVCVLPFTLPDDIAMRSNFGGLGGGLARYLGMDANSQEFAAVEDQYIDALLAHRAIPSSLGNIWPQWTPEDGIDDSRSGERLRAMVEDRHVNSLCVPFAYRDEPEKCQAYLRDLATYLRSKGWLDLAYIYMEDEPNDAQQYETVRHQGELIRESGIKRLCTEQTVTSDPAWGTLYGAVDIWCPLWCLYDEKTARTTGAGRGDLDIHSALPRQWPGAVLADRLLSGPVPRPVLGELALWSEGVLVLGQYLLDRGTGRMDHSALPRSVLGRGNVVVSR